MPRISTLITIKSTAVIIGLLLSGTAFAGTAGIKAPDTSSIENALPAPAPLNNAAPAPVTDEAERIYKNFGDAVYQVQVIDLASGKKSTIGSGFQFDAEGYMATNYHVVSQAIQRSNSNRLEYLHERAEKSGDGQSDEGVSSRGALTVVMADVVHDIAILKMDKPGTDSLKLGNSRLPKGTRLFSLGNPHDIGFTIIEGTYNGLSKDSFIDKIHFSGSLNPGMSGGPALNHKGEVIGINVSTAGNQISFLVPVEHLAALAQTALKADHETNAEKKEDFVKYSAYRVEDQLVAMQDKSVDRILNSKWDSIAFGPAMVPGRMNDAFRCWGSPQHNDEDPYTYYRSTCAVQENIYLDQDFTTGGMSYTYDLIKGKDDLNLQRFYNFYELAYSFPADGYDNVNEGDATNFTCNSRFVEIEGEKWKSAFCVRQYKRYPKLFDMHVYMALLNHGREGLLTSFVAQGVTSDNAIKLADAFMKNIKPLDKSKVEAAKATPDTANTEGAVPPTSPPVPAPAQPAAPAVEGAAQ